MWKGLPRGCVHPLPLYFSKIITPDQATYYMRQIPLHTGGNLRYLALTSQMAVVYANIWEEIFALFSNHEDRISCLSLWGLTLLSPHRQNVAGPLSQGGALYSYNEIQGFSLTSLCWW